MNRIKQYQNKISSRSIEVATLTLALPKQGLFNKEVLPWRGELFLGDISVSPTLYAESSLNLKVNPDIFAQSAVVKLPFKHKKEFL